MDRIEGIVQPQNIYMLTNEQYAPIIREQFPDMRPEQILLEPCRRNTAPCIAWAAYHIHALDPEAQIMVAPSDHLVLKADRFRDSVLKAFEFIERTDAILTLGIKPHRPETGYGYIQVGDHVGGDFSAVKTFTEKPNAELAQVFLQSGEFYWNSGMFFWSAQCIIESIRSFAPDIAQKLDPGMGIYGTPGEKAFIEQNFPSCPSISIDFAVMEKAPNVYVECVDIGWSDLGTWGSLYEISPKNIDGNVTQRCKALMINSHNNIMAVKGDKVVVASGLNDFIIADVDDVLLIVPREEEQKIKLYVNEVKSKFGEQYL